MTGLATTHAAFAAALRDPTAGVPASLRSHLPEAAARTRFNVYRNNVYASLIGVLEARFPAVLRLVGDDFFRAMARIFIDRAPPRSPILLHYGRSFPDFLLAFEPVEDEPYLADVARVEWQMHAARHAADCKALTGAELARALELSAGGAVLTFVPAVSIIRSPFPVFAIWRANSADDGQPYPQSFSGSETVVVTRPALAPEAVRLPNGTAEFVAALLEGERLETAAAIGITANADFSVQRAVGMFVAQRMIQSVIPAPQRGTP